MTSPIAYLNGEYVPIEQTHLHVFDLGVVGGVSVAEMVRTFGHVPFRLDQHLQRLQHSLDEVGLQAGVSIQELEGICQQVIAHNAGLIPAGHDLGLIVFVTAGLNPTYVGNSARSGGFSSTVCVHTFPLPFELWAASYTEGLHLTSVSTRSLPAEVIDPRIKHRSRLHWHLAAREARRVDPKALAILADEEGNLTETATGNLCVVDGLTIVTPSANVLEGVSRDYVTELAAALGISFVHARISADDLARADEAFLTSTPHCLLPVVRLNGSLIGSGQPGPVFQRLMTAWNESVGIDVVAQMQRGAAERQPAK